MIFASFQRLVGVSSTVASNIVFVRNICTISVCRKSFKCGSRYFEVRSALCPGVVLLDNATKRSFSKKSGILRGAEEKMPVLQIKKRPIRRKRLISEDEEFSQPGFWHVKAFATAEEYHLETLMEGLRKQDLYIPNKINTSSKCKLKICEAIVNAGI